MNKRILIIEDDENVRETLEFLLRHNGFTISTCSSGRDFFNTIKRTAPDLILLDIVLGELDGRDICKMIKDRTETAHIPIIIISSVHDIFNSILDQNANDVIPKPFTEEVLLNRVQRQLSVI
jgi:two-component system phosphate regulon response regulator PhoB